MNDLKQNTGLAIGTLFTIACLLCSLTTLIPFLSVLPGSYLELFLRDFMPDASNSKIGMRIIWCLSAMMITLIFLCIRDLRKRIPEEVTVSRSYVMAFMCLFYLVVHPLAMYIYWGVALHFRNDGQMIFTAQSSFPYSSFAFAVFGGIIDYTIQKSRKPVGT